LPPLRPEPSPRWVITTGTVLGVELGRKLPSARRCCRARVAAFALALALACDILAAAPANATHLAAGGG
jgi:hypothetical protein